MTDDDGREEDREDEAQQYREWWSASGLADHVKPSDAGTIYDLVWNPGPAACGCCGRDPKAHWLKCIYAVLFWWPHRARSGQNPYRPEDDADEDALTATPSRGLDEYYGSQYGGTITSVLINTPGESASVVTCIDGYQMALQGRAGPALGVAAIGSFIAGTFGTILLMLMSPTLARWALPSGPWAVEARA